MVALHLRFRHPSRVEAFGLGQDSLIFRSELLCPTPAQRNVNSGQKGVSPAAQRFVDSRQVQPVIGGCHPRPSDLLTQDMDIFQLIFSCGYTYPTGN